MNYWGNYYSILLITSRTRRADFVCKQKHLSSVSAFFRQFKSADLPFQNEDNFGVGFIDLVQSHHIWVGLGQLQHCYLVEDVHAAVCSLSSLSQKLGSILLSRCLLSAFLYHSKFSPGNQKGEIWREWLAKRQTNDNERLFLMKQVMNLCLTKGTVMDWHKDKAVQKHHLNAQTVTECCCALLRGWNQMFSWTFLFSSLAFSLQKALTRGR